LRITQAAGGGAEAVTVIPTVIHSPFPLPDERIVLPPCVLIRSETARARD
jgi:hypothetical protein